MSLLDLFQVYSKAMGNELSDSQRLIRLSLGIAFEVWMSPLRVVVW